MSDEQQDPTGLDEALQWDPALQKLHAELPPILNVRQVAELMGCSVDVVYNMVHNGDIVARKWGQQFRFLREDLIDALRKLDS